MRIPEMTLSQDGQYRSDWRIAFRFDKDVLANILAVYAERYNIEFPDGQYLSGMELSEYAPNISPIQTMQYIRAALFLYGYSATVFDGEESIREWAKKQVDILYTKKERNGRKRKKP